MEHAADLWGLEYSAREAEELRRMGVENIVVGNATKFDLGRTFDCIVAGELIEHLGDLDGFLASCRRHMNPGGRIVISTPYPHGLPHVLYAWSKYPKTCSNDEHVLWLCPTTLTQLAGRAGLDVEIVELVADFRTDVGSRVGRLVARLGRVARHVLPPRVMATNFVAVLLDREPQPTVIDDDA